MLTRSVDPAISVSVPPNFRSTNCERTTGTGAPDSSAEGIAPLIRSSFSKVWMLLKNLRELGSSVVVLAILGETESQRSEVGSRENGGLGDR